MLVFAGGQGLGFSVTTRDNPTLGVAPIYIKNILAQGAARQDGRLRAGDRLLSVNDEETEGRTQGEVVQQLKETRVGGRVRLLISRIQVSQILTKIL